MTAVSVSPRIGDVSISPPRVSERESDAELMRRVQDGDADAFAQLYDRHAARAFGVARSVCRSTALAEDAVQEGFLSIWRSRATYGAARGSFSGWSMRVVRNRAIDLMRREASPSRPQSVKLEDDPPDVRSAPVDEQVIAGSDGEALRNALRLLPELQAQVVALAFLGGLSHSEISRRLSVPTGTVKGRIRLGLEKLRGLMEAHA